MAAAGDHTAPRSLFANSAAFDAWSDRWRVRLDLEPPSAADRKAAMDLVNPAFIPRNHHVEEMIAAATERGDFGPFNELVDVLARPFEEQPRFAHLAQPPEMHERVLATFCGT